MRSGAFVLLGLLGACSEAPTTESAAVDKLSIDKVEMTATGARYTAERDGRQVQIDFAVPRDRVAPERVHIATPVHSTENGIVVMQDDYASRPADGRCEDGIESFIRVFSLAERRELGVISAVSCRERIGAEKARAPQVTWIGNGRFRIEGDPARNFAIGNGRVTELKGS
jgi:hypothetical protein